jgi:8-oxo-dGTP pyrophosphatase MutT (NUDIX family)
VARSVGEGVAQAAAAVARLSENGDVVEAAGGVVWRRGDDGRVEVLLVHRPKYDDWTLPKGKLDAGERYQDAARREVEEETGVRGALGEELPTTSYTDRHGRPKVVRYWAIEAEGGDFRPNREVDEVRWLPAEDAIAALSYDHDGEVVKALGK